MRNVTRCPMKRQITKNQWDALPPNIRLLILFWKLYVGYQVREGLDFFQIVEFARFLGAERKDVDLYFETHSADGSKYFNNAILFNEFVLAFDDEQPIDSLFYETTVKAKQFLLTNAGQNDHRSL